MFISGTPHRPAHLSLLLRLVAVLAVGLIAAVGFAGPASAVTHSQATAAFSANGVLWTSSGGCSDRNNSTCTSFDGLRQASVDGAITLRNASGCGLTITGGTEVGHAAGTYSHANGYKLDLSRTTCLTSWVHNTYAYIGLRGDGAAQYQSASGNVYADEGNHWDVTYHNCGGC